MLERIRSAWRLRHGPARVNRYRWNRWSAPVDVLLRAISLASSELHSWFGTDPALQVTTERLVDSQKRGSLTKHTTLDPLEQTRELGFRSLKRLTVLLSDVTGTERVELVLKRTPPVLTLGVIGADANSASELAGRLADILNGGVRRPLWFRRRQLLASLVVVIAIGLALGFLSALPVSPFSWFAGALILSAVLLVAFALFPDLEVSETSDTRFKRWWRSAAAFLAVLASGLTIYQFLRRR